MMEMNEKQLRMIDEALTTHIDRLEKLRFNTQEQHIKVKLFSRIEEFRNLQDDVEILLLRY